MSISEKTVLNYLKEVKDPEVPVLDVVEMGIVRGVRVREDSVAVEITPTYSGCPALKAIEEEIVHTLVGRGFRNVEVRHVYSPPWTTNWMSDEARRKLKEFGIAPPARILEPTSEVPDPGQVPCPYCDSARTELRSVFGSTACKAFYFCHECRQPFESFKRI